MSEANKKESNGEMPMPPIPQQQQQQQQQQTAIMIDSMKKKHKHVSNTSTPNPYIEKREDGFEYVDEGYMRALLNEFFPLWNWEIKEYQILGDAEIIVHGRLTIVDEGLPRYFEAVASHRIAKNAKGYVNISNNLKSANTDAFKVAVNRLCNIADDVYRKKLIDYNISEAQRDFIYSLLKNLGDDELVKRIENEIDSLGINSQNYEATIRRLKQIKGE